MLWSVEVVRLTFSASDLSWLTIRPESFPNLFNNDIRLGRVVCVGGGDEQQ